MPFVAPSFCEERSRAIILKMKYFVYILQSQKDKSHYTGMTENVEKRLIEHNAGSGHYSNSKKPFSLIWFCAFNDKKIALAFEKYLKQGSGFAFARKHLI